MTIFPPHDAEGTGEQNERNEQMKTKAKAMADMRPGEGANAAAPNVAEWRRERREIEPSMLKSAPWNPRGEVTPESVADLAASMRTLGVIQPLVAMLDKDGGTTLVAGHRRLVAAKATGLATVPVDVLVGVDRETARRMTFIENLQRKDADPLLESELVGDLVKSGMTQAEIAAETGRGREWVARRANLANLSKSWRRRVKGGEQITTDCLEHVAAYPEAVQESLKDAQGWKHENPLRWSDLRGAFARETCDLKGAKFDRKKCRTCPNNTGCAPDLFDWDGKPSAFGKCLDAKCYKRKVADAIEAAIADAKERGATVKESERRPDCSIDLQSKPDERHDTLYVWKDWNGEPQMQWGEAPKRSGAAVGPSDEEREERKRKIAANKARRKLSEWCDGNLAGVVAATYTVDVQTARAFQTLFDLDGAWRVFGSRTSAKDAARAHLLNPGASPVAPSCERWAELAAQGIAAKVVRPEVGAGYAELLLAILPAVASALTDEERRLVVSDERLAELRSPVRMEWEGAREETEEEETEADDE